MPDYASLFTGSSSSDKKAERGEAARYRLLLVDDEINVLRALRRVFQRENYEILTAESADAALQLLAQGEEVQVVISDYLMPGMNGADFLKKVKQLYPETLRIMLTGHADTGAVMGAINEGAVYKFILKPWNDDDLRITVGLALEQHDLIQRNRVLRETNARQSKELKSLSKLTVTNRSQIAIMLHKRGLLSDKQLQALYRDLQQTKAPVLKLILDKGWIEENKIRSILKKDFLFDEVALAEFQVEPAVTELLPRAFCERNMVVPLKVVNRRLTLAMADPMDEGLIEDLRFAAGLEIDVVMAGIAEIEQKIGEIYQGMDISFEEMEELVSTVDPFESIEVVIEDKDDISIEELLRETEEPPAVRLVNAIVIEAVRLEVSDIHIQPRAKSVAVRFRIDGLLKDKIHIPHQMHNSLVSRIKVMAEMDIAERRRPQDGRITVKTPMRIVDLRISTLPTINGEKVVLRILDRNASIRHLSDLGFRAQDLERVDRLASKPQGIILATGPTGSGKTNTLYSLLNHNASSDKNYVTIEDPVEFFMDMAGQVHIREQIGLTFPIVLRSILRQDPDVILLGEIRDFDTAEVAFHAALTGHLVFSTLHTNSAVATIARLFDLGLKPYVVASALEGIIAQRLVRRICPACRDAVPVDRALLGSLGPLFSDLPPAQVFKGGGCRKCHGSGYQGRTGVYEVLLPDNQMRHLMTSGASLLELNRYAVEHAQHTMLMDAREKVEQGITTLEEVLRVFGPQDPEAT
jgi:type II secretory ATPase GspE/PulE/Tfp pilus assembly ATPase PilB-like protein/DNA-binding NarL/FixJ family response regulator